MLQNDCFFLSLYKKIWWLPLFPKFSGGPLLFSYMQSSLRVTSWLTLQYLQTLARKNLCVPATSTQAGWDGCWKKKALSVRRICQHATILEGQSWALDCLCHCDVFSTINWLLSFLNFLSDGFLFHTSESIVYRKLPHKYIYYACETIND